MSVANLHSLLSTNWFINQNYAQSLLPSLMGVLSGTTFTEASPQPEAFIMKSNGALMDNEDFSAANNKESYVLLISLKNPIYKYDQYCGPEGTKSKQAIIASTESDPNCAGVVLDIDSGGGQVAGTPEFYDFLKNYSKPIVSYTDGLMCSAAYYIGSAADHIIANKRADAIGSIGAMVSFLDFTGMYEKKGAKLIKAYATKSTEKNADVESMLQGDVAPYIQNQLDPIVEDFISDIKATRTNVSEQVFKGATYNASKAIKLGLVDEMGTLTTAINKVFELSGLKSKTQNKKNMKKFNKLEAALNVEDGFASNDNGVFFNEEQLETLENLITTQETELTNAQTALQNANDNFNSAMEDSVAIAAEVSGALEAAGVENHEELSTLEGIAMLQNLILEYGKKDAAEHTNTISSGDSAEAENSNYVYGYDVSAALNN